METNLEGLDQLEDLLVSEFRTWQALTQLAREEREALAQQNLKKLKELVERKVLLLEQASSLEQARKAQFREAGVQVQREADWNLVVQAGSEAASALNGSGVFDRLARLFSGLLALLDRLREITRMNRSLASSLLWSEGLVPAEPGPLQGAVPGGGGSQDAV
jgi:flagellar biosynthesis/type III secretory pathway chaperone